MNILENLEQLLAYNNITKSKLAKDINISASTIYSWWDKGVSTINITTIVKISEYFNISIDDLIYKDLSRSYEELIEARIMRDKTMIDEIKEILEKYEKL